MILQIRRQVNKGEQVRLALVSAQETKNRQILVLKTRAENNTYVVGKKITLPMIQEIRYI